MQIELFCTCQMPEIYDDMVECDTCGEWYHPKCSNFHQKAKNGTVMFQVIVFLHKGARSDSCMEMPVTKYLDPRNV